MPNHKNNRLIAVFTFFALTGLLCLVNMILETTWKALSLSRIVIIMSGISLLSLIVLKWQSTKDILRNFFYAADHPMNLAIFRVVFYYNIFKWIHLKRILSYSQTPRELINAPTGVEWIIPFLPLNDQVVTTCCYLMILACFFAMIGFKTRLATVMTAILGVYILGIPQLYGKVTHYHYLLWFPIILSTSRCGDYLSVDSVLASWKRADQGILQAPLPHRAYALPLRLIWMLIGVIYFFPGFWKVWGMGFYWALSDNIIYQMYMKWYEFEGWLPAFRIDHYPLLYKSSALGTILFEMSFIVLIFFPRLKYIPAVGGLVFHNLTHVFMRIRFMALQICYVAFFNWYAIFRYIGRFLFSKELYVIFDGNCQICRRTIATFNVLDLFHRITYVNGLDKNQLSQHGLTHLDEAALMKDIHVVTGDSVFRGFNAYRVLGRRMPIFWIILPFMYIWPVSFFGRVIYRKFADTRACRIPLAGESQQRSYYGQYAYGFKAMIIAGVILIAANSGFGFTGHGNGWPFACFPTFAFKGKNTAKTLEIEVTYKDGRRALLNAHMLNEKYGSANVRGLVRNVIYEQDEVRKKEKIKAFWETFVDFDPQLNNVNSIDIYEIKYSIVPEDVGSGPLERNPIYIEN